MLNPVCMHLYMNDRLQKEVPSVAIKCRISRQAVQSIRMSHVKGTANLSGLRLSRLLLNATPEYSVREFFRSRAYIHFSWTYRKYHLGGTNGLRSPGAPLNPRPAGVFGRTRPAGGGADSAPPPCLTRERVAVARWARRQTKALDEYF